MAGKWRQCRWGELTTLEYGKGLRGYEYATGPHRVFGTNGPIGWHSEPLCKHPTVIVGRKGAYRGIHYSASPCFVIDTAFYLSPKTDFYMRWAYYELLAQDINSMDSGSAIPSTSRDDFYHLPVKLPPLPEQKAIAHILGTLDDKIELNRRMNETLEAMARAIFKSWFVDFDPVKAKAEGRKPNLPKEIAALFPDSFQDSPLGKIPKGWEAGILDDIAEVTSGKRPENRSDNRDDVSSIPLFGGGGPMAYVQKSLYEQPIILTGRVGTLGVVFRIACPCWPSDNTLVILPRKAQWYDFIYHGVCGFDFFSLNRGSTQPLVTQSDLQKQQCLIPSVDVIGSFHLFLSALYDKVDLLTKESDTLAAIRDALLPKLMSGEIRVKDAGKFIQEV